MESVQVHSTEVDGVPVLWVDRTEPGPLHVSLCFRVGKVDESLPQNGITHLLEHVVLHGVDQVQDESHHNGSVSNTMTTFVVGGSEDEVCRFLLGVCEGLTDVPVGHLEHEQRVLEAESARTKQGPLAHLMMRRFGPAGPGLWWCNDFGAINATPDSLRAWSAQHFTRGNAVLILDGNVPDGLQLPLPPGDQLPVPPLVDRQHGTPLWVASDFPEIVTHTIVDRSAAAVAWAAIAQQRLVARLRAGEGIAYSPSVSYDPYDGGTAQVSAVADAHPEHLVAAAMGMSDVVEELAAAGPTEAELESYRAQLRRSLDVPPPPVAVAYRQAHDLLHDHPTQSPGEISADIEALTVPSVREVGQQARQRMVYALPADVSLPPGRAAAVRSRPAGPEMIGSYYRPATDEKFLITQAPEGVSWTGPDDEYVAVRYDACCGVLCWPDGKRVLVNDSGETLTIEPTLWQSGRGLVSLIDQSTASVRIPMPPRAPDEIPRLAPMPAAATTSAKPVRSKSAAANRAILSGSVMLGLAGLFGVTGAGAAPGLVWMAAAFGVVNLTMGLQGLYRNRQRRR
ncbi:MAG TPA: insulinase family protein [Candidatus Nanopelagicales bacterium]|nr:insulinase family protein [Candidatus Nanopelagicales bacterium]